MEQGKKLQPAISVKNLKLDYLLSLNSIKSVLVALTKRTKIVKKINVIKNVSFDVFPGELVCIGGANGTGKSSLYYALCGKMKPSEGTITVNGRIAAFFGGNFGLSPYDTGYDVLKYLTAIHGGSMSEFEDNLQSYSKLSGLSVDLIGSQPIHTYSSGMRARLMASFSLFNHQEINIFDETLSVGDMKYNEFASNKIREKIGMGGVYLITSHERVTWEKISEEPSGRFIILSRDGVAYDGKNLQQALNAYEKSEKYVTSNE